MIWVLRNISLHLWITTLVAVPVIFYILPGFTRVFPGSSPITTGLVIVIGIVMAAGFFMDRMALKAVSLLIKEGEAWERSGILNKAEKNYIRALRIYDTFLLWPFSAKRAARMISFAIAKFKLNTAVDNPNFKLASAVYLKMNPADEDIARLWLSQLKQSASVTSFEQDVLSLLVEKQYASRHSSPLLLDIFLGLERKDFIAQKLYQHVLEDPGLERTYSEKIESLIGTSGETLQQEIPFQPPPYLPGKKIEAGKKRQALGLSSLTYLKRVWLHLGSVVRFFVLSVSKWYAYTRDHEKAQFYVKISCLVIVSIGLLFFMISTISHMFKPGTVETENIKTEIIVPKPFTIQVAAYLKQAHAERYVAALNKKGIDASVKKVGGGGKTWFVVRVSEFVDKQSATAYGRKLKQEKIIDDFFVNNR